MQTEKSSGVPHVGHEECVVEDKGQDHGSATLDEVIQPVDLSDLCGEQVGRHTGVQVGHRLLAHRQAEPSVRRGHQRKAHSQYLHRMHTVNICTESLFAGQLHLPPSLLRPAMLLIYPSQQKGSNNIHGVKLSTPTYCTW